MKKTVKGFVDSEGNEYQYKDEIARSQNQNLEEEINSNKTYMDKVKTELKNDNKTLNGRIDTILTGTVNTTKLVTVHSATIRNNSASDLTFKISSKDNETLKSIKDKSPTVINANVIAKALDGVAINGKGIPSSYNVESTNDEYVITVYSGSSSVVGQYVFMAVVTIAYEDIATDISSAELKDVRTGANGTTYPTAGDAVREQINDLKKELDDSNLDENVLQIQKNMNDICSLKEDLDNNLTYLSTKTSTNEKKAYDITSLFTLKGFLNKKGDFVKGTALCTDYLSAKKGETYYCYVSQDDNNSLPIAIYDFDKNFVKGVENKGRDYNMSQFSYTIEEDCLIRISSMNTTVSLIYKEECKNTSEMFDDIERKIGQLKTYYEDITEDVMKNKIEDSYLNDNGKVTSYNNSFVSDYIDVEEGDVIQASSYVLYGNPVLAMYFSNNETYKTYGGANGKISSVNVTIPPMVKSIRISTLDATKEVSLKILRSQNVIETIKEATRAKNYVIPSTYEEIDLKNKTSGFLQEDGTIMKDNNWNTSEYIDLDNYDYIRLVSDYGYGACGYVTFDSNKIVLSYVKDSQQSMKRIDIIPENDFPKAKYIRFCGTVQNLHIYANKQSSVVTDILTETLQTGNVLYGKKIAFCGDSFTEASNLGKTLYDNFTGCYKSYGWRIANRNKMQLYHDGIGGSTMHIVDTENPDEKHPFSYKRYKNIPTDCDYIILQFGLNESNIANDESTKGTKDSTDKTTMWGSWNVVLEYLIKNCPKARIGIIMSDAWMPQSYFTTLSEICEWWGIPLKDLGGDLNVPVMNSGRRNGSGLVLNPEVAKLRNSVFYTSESDAHPNDAAHEWRSTVIENFIRSL